MKASWSISELATEFGVTPRTIRFYEDKGLIAPARNGQTRVYSKADRVRLALILRGKSLGFSLEDISDMLALYSRPDGGLEQTTVTLAKIDERITALERQRAAIDQSLADLAESRRAVASRLDELKRRGPRAAE